MLHATAFLRSPSVARAPDTAGCATTRPPHPLAAAPTASRRAAVLAWLAAWLVAAALAGVIGCGGADAGQDAITPAALADRLAAGDTPLVLDVRSTGEYGAGHIPGAVHIPHDEHADRLDELPAERDTEIVVHCQTGRRAAHAESVLAEAGYTRVRDLTGHWAAWSKSSHRWPGNWIAARYAAPCVMATSC